MNKYAGKISVACMAGMLSLAACKNESSSTVGTYEREDAASLEEGTAKHENENSSTKNPARVYIDSSKSVDSALRKKDAGASPEKNSANTSAKSNTPTTTQQE